jgi:hypothetical protein
MAEDHQKTIAKLKKKISKKENKIKEKRNDIKAKEKEIEEQVKKIEELEVSKIKFKTRYENAKEHIVQKDLKLAQNKQEIKQLKNRISELEDLNGDDVHSLVDDAKDEIKLGWIILDTSEKRSLLKHHIAEQGPNHLSKGYATAACHKLQNNIAFFQKSLVDGKMKYTGVIIGKFADAIKADGKCYFILDVVLGVQGAGTTIMDTLINRRHNNFRKYFHGAKQSVMDAMEFYKNKCGFVELPQNEKQKEKGLFPMKNVIDLTN